MSFSRFYWTPDARVAAAIALLFVVTSWLAPNSATGQDAAPEAETTEEVDVPDEVGVEPVAGDDQIAVRLVKIMEATEWFTSPRVTVDEGVVFLRGEADSEPHKEWAARLASKTQDVVAVVNKITVAETSMWDLSPAWQELQQLAADAFRSSPLVAVGLLLLGVTLLATRWSVVGARHIFSRRLKSQLLRDVAARAAAVPVFLLGLYLVLRVSGLTKLAVTVLGGTGLVGLVVGFAFRDIAENFLASVLISIQRPFARGDLVKVSEFEGFVQSVNTRSTLLMTLDGNHVQIPNATIYKETIVNFSANSNGRFDFAVGIGYADSISKAQTTALDVLQRHPAVLDNPEPLILVENLGASTVNLRIYFWTDVNVHSGLKVRSAVIRQIKQEFEDAGISMPDEAREVVFPAGVPVQMISDAPQAAEAPGGYDRSDSDRADPDGEESETHAAEGNLAAEANEIEKQARQARPPEDGSNLLD